MAIRRINKNTVELSEYGKTLKQRVEETAKSVKPVEGNFDFLKAPRKRGVT